jgi:hypothetical protein
MAAGYPRTFVVARSSQAAESPTVLPLQPLPLFLLQGPNTDMAEVAKICDTVNAGRSFCGQFIRYILDALSVRALLHFENWISFSTG